ncbi:hypothetical protein LCGC14_2471130, partial [marine sediment metagenome]
YYGCNNNKYVTIDYQQFVIDKIAELDQLFLTDYGEENIILEVESYIYTILVGLSDLDSELLNEEPYLIIKDHNLVSEFLNSYIKNTQNTKCQNLATDLLHAHDEGEII